MNQTKTTPKDFFLHLGATVALYVGIVSIINLYFSVVNYYFPDVLAGSYYASYIALPISVLIVVVPVLYVLEWLIKKDLNLIPDKAESWIRKWRIYLTLFLAGVVMAGDLIVLINTYLSGEISARFIYKFLIVLVIMGIVFVYYILEKIEKSVKLKSVLAYVGIIISILAIVLGFMVVGSPTKQRNIRFDSQRVSDLQNIQYQILNYWQQKSKLPSDLKEMKDPLSGVSIPTDPSTKIEYEYRIKNQATNTFELCSVFSLKTQDNKGRGAYYDSIATSYYPGFENDSWNHEPGRVCFERTIDSEKYPPYKK